MASDRSRPLTRGSELEILQIEQPFRNHNGGAVRFGPDGLLYLGLGDGGGGGDPQGNGQDRATLLGSIIRIDVSAATAEEPYRIPPDNPFLTTAGARPELWAYGLRNPWRMAFDPATGALWVADVGQGRIEEVDRVVAGGNYGWNRLEGDQCFRPSEDCDRSGTVAPLATYTHEGGLLGHGWGGLPGQRRPGADGLLPVRRFLQRAHLGARHRGRGRPRARSRDRGRYRLLWHRRGRRGLRPPLRRPPPPRGRRGIAAR